MQVRSEIDSDKATIIVENGVTYQEVEITIDDGLRNLSISVDGPTLIKAIQNAMND